MLRKTRQRTAPKRRPRAPSIRPGRHREHRLRLREGRRQDHLDVVVEHLRVDRRRALVLAVDELGRPIGHDVAGEGRAFQRRGDLGAVGRGGALERVGDEQHAAVVHVDFVGEELALVLDLLLQRQRLRIARIEPVIAVHDVLGGFREFLDEFVGGRRAAEHRIDALRPHLLLLHGAREQHVFVVVVGRDHEIRVLRLDLEHDVVEVARRRRMRDRLEDLEAVRRQLRVEQLGEAGAEQPNPRARSSRSWPACRRRR